MVLVKLLPQLEFLWVLSLANYQIEEIPKSIGSLKHLRYLNFSNTMITCLPEEAGELYNLQSLLLSRCDKLSSLPNSFEKLINLRHLDVRDTPKLDKMPLGIGGLTSLRTLSKVILGGTGEFKISDLKDLLHLEGHLSIEGLDKVNNAEHTKEAKLQQKQGLRELEFKWSDVFDDSRNEKTEYEVLEGLRPFEKLTSLLIMNYKGTKFPSWVGDVSFDCLTQLKLRACKRCTCLPTLGNLPSLQTLVIESMDELKRLGSELLRPPNSCSSTAFPSLEVLEFRDIKGWVEWSANGAFPCLNKISLINCPELDVVAIDLIPSLRDCYIEGCSVAVLTRMVRVSSSIIRLTLREITGLTLLRGEVLKHLQAVEYLMVSDCDELTFLWESEVEASKILVSLKKLEVSDCKNFISLGEKKVDLMISMESLREVKISNCPRFESYNCPNYVEKLEIYWCDSIASLTFPTVDEHDNLPSALKDLEIEGCHNLEMSWLLNNFLSTLESLEIGSMLNLRLFPDGCFFHVTTLRIENCDNIESIPHSCFLGLRSLCIRSCKNLKLFPRENLQSLTSLEVMEISFCPSIDDTFPCGVVSFAKAEEEDMRRNTTTCSSFLLPSSLTNLWILNFEELESVSKGMQHLTCLQRLYIDSCPKLRDLPETLLPSLSILTIESSTELRRKCKRRKGKYWPIISQIPHLHISSED